METGWCEKNCARARQLGAQCGGWWLVLFGEKAVGVLTLLADIGRTWPGIQKRGLKLRRLGNCIGSDDASLTDRKLGPATLTFD
jgi:hypothetical protein